MRDALRALCQNLECMLRAFADDIPHFISERVNLFQENIRKARHKDARGLFYLQRKIENRSRFPYFFRVVSRIIHTAAIHVAELAVGIHLSASYRDIPRMVGPLYFTVFHNSKFKIQHSKHQQTNSVSGLLYTLSFVSGGMLIDPPSAMIAATIPSTRRPCTLLQPLCTLIFSLASV